MLVVDDISATTCPACISGEPHAHRTAHPGHVVAIAVPVVSSLCGKWQDHADCSGWTSGTNRNRLVPCGCACHVTIVGAEAWAPR